MGLLSQAFGSILIPGSKLAGTRLQRLPSLPSPGGTRSPAQGPRLTVRLLLLLLLSHFSRVRLCVTPWTVAHKAPLSIGFSRQEYWRG